MGFIGFLVLFGISFFVPDWIGALLAGFGLAVTIVHFIDRIRKKEKLQILNTVGTAAFCVFFIWLMMR